MPETISIPAVDAYPLAADLFQPEKPDGAVVIVNSAMGVPRRFYRAFASHLCDKGFTVVLYDYRGVGGSAPKRLLGFEATVSDWGAKDFAGVLDWVKTRWPGQRTMVIGHSIGGQIIGLAPGAEGIDRALLVAAQSGFWGHWAGGKRIAMWLCWHMLVPGLTKVAGMMPMKLLGQGQNVPAGVALQWASWGRLPGYMFDPRARVPLQRYPRLRMPMRIYSFADDVYAPLPAVRALTREYQNTQKEHLHLGETDLRGRSIGHFGFFKPACRDLWDKAAEWLSGRHHGARAVMRAAAR